MPTSSELDSITRADLAAHPSVKWDIGADQLGAFIAEMDFGIAGPIEAATEAALRRGQTGYLPGWLINEMSQAYSAWASEHYRWDVDPADVRPVSDVLAALELVMDHFTEPGAPVILPTPAYMPFLRLPLAHSRRIIEVPMVRGASSYSYDLPAIERAFEAGGRLLILCNPHNPIGRVLSAGEMAEIAKIVDRFGGRVFADEIHAPLTHPGFRHTPYVSISELTASHTITATSASKAWNLPGMKCAQVVLSNDTDRAKWAEVATEAEHSPATLGVVSTIAAYREGGPWLADILQYLDASRLLLANLVAEHLPGVGYTPPEGTYLAWLDCRGLGLENPRDFFAEQAGVITVDGALCGVAGEGFVRFNTAMPAPLMRQALERMGAALAGR